MSDVRTWLAGIGLGQYADAFEANDVLGDLLRCTGDLAAAEGSYVEALALARRQSAKEGG